MGWFFFFFFFKFLLEKVYHACLGQGRKSNLISGNIRKHNSLEAICNVTSLHLSLSSD